MDIYRVASIEEQIYGCEELPEGQPLCCDVVLENSIGTKKTLSLPDRWLTEHGIDEGSLVRLGAGGSVSPAQPTRRVYFTRHGETEWNAADRICGTTDSPLTAKGRAQAAELGRRVKESGLAIDEILYSPLSRAADTALAIAAATGIPARPEPRLREQCFGHFEGMAPRRNEEFREAKTHFADRYEGGESMLQLAQRVYNVLDEVAAQTEKTYLLVAHNGITRMVNSYFYNMTNEEYAIAGITNCQLVEYFFD